MCKLCVFAGTAEGRELVEFLGNQPASVTACVATEYGEALLPEGDSLTVSAGRFDREEMETLLMRERFDLVVDATHPYARAVTENLVRACAAAGVEYLRLLREEAAVPEDALFVPDAAGAAEFLSGTEGNILLTTGSKELACFSEVRGFAQRVYARVLPMEDSLRLCREAGLPPAHILAMQGPFSQELNAAMLRSVSARYLVTKEGGRQGGFGEKAAAARETGATLVVIGRPEQREGMDLSAVIRLLCRRFGWRARPRVQVVGLGPGGAGTMTEEARRAIEGADCVIGAGRMVRAARPGQAVFEAIAPDAIAAYIRAHGEFRRFAVVMSGDTGFFSGTKKLLPLLEDCEVSVLPGVSALSCLCARLGTSYEDVACVSVHGRDRDIVPDVRANRRVFALVGGENGAGRLCRELTGAGLGDVQVSVGERLSYPEEAVTVGAARELADRAFAPLSAVLIENEAAAQAAFGLPDEAFQRGGEGRAVPMTKSEVRAVCLSKLRLTADAVCWDVGAGTGSVSIEMALQARRGQVYAIERREDARALLEENRARFHAGNLTVVPGCAPEVCEGLPAPTHAFLGGTSGRLREIVALLLEKNPRVRIVAAAIALESVGELTACMKEFPFTHTQVVSLSVARDRKAGGYRLMTGQNPVYVFTMQGGGAQL